MKCTYILSAIAIGLASVLLLGTLHTQAAQALKIDTYWIKTGSFTVPIGTVRTVSANCPAGGQVTGGGFTVDAGNILISRSVPDWTGTIDRWLIDAKAPVQLNPSGIPKITAWVVCSRLLP